MLKNYLFLWGCLSGSAVLALTIDPAIAATAETMSQGVLILVLYWLTLCLPIPYGFLLAVYSLLPRNRSVDVSMWLYAVSVLLLILVTLAVIVIVFSGTFTEFSAWEILYGIDLVAIVLIAILIFHLVRLGKLWVVIAFIPASVLLLIFSLIVARLYIFTD